MQKSKTTTLIRCALFASLVAIGAFIQIPVPYMDYFTLQFLFVILAGMLLGSVKGATAIGVYVLTGLMGVPIFAAGGGIGYVLRPSFGYLLGFVAAAWMCGFCVERLPQKGFKGYLMASFAGLVVCYAIGLLYKSLILNLYMRTKTTWAVVLLSCFPLDLPGDCILCFIAALLATKLKVAVKI